MAPAAATASPDATVDYGGVGCCGVDGASGGDGCGCGGVDVKASSGDGCGCGGVDVGASRGVGCGCCGVDVVVDGGAIVDGESL